MKKRNILAVVLLPFVTLGIYSLYWFVKTKGELNAKGAQIPTAWLLIIPLVNIWWLWKYFEGAEQVTNKKVNSILMFVLGVFVTSLISMALCQDAYNNLGEFASNVESDTPVDTITDSKSDDNSVSTPPTQPTPPTIPTV
jgi:membrane protease YdiL (CAAX protease family)